MSDAFWFYACLATWLIVIPCLLIWPPQLRTVRHRFRDTRDSRILQQCRLKDKWEQQHKRGGSKSTTPNASMTNLTNAGGAVAAVVGGATTPNAAGVASNPHQTSLPEALGLPRWVIPKNAPVIVAVVNHKSGGQLGAATMRSLEMLLHPHQIFDLAVVPNMQAILRSFTGAFKLLVCGGDGTVAWAMDAAIRCGVRPPMGILPLGTGNDLSRSLGWGAGFGMGDVTKDSVREVLIRMHKYSEVQNVDRWRVTFVPKNSPPGSDIVQKTMINYFSMGVDAEISLKFHNERLEYPERFSSQTKNVLKYAMLGFEKSFEGRPLNGRLEVSADGKRLDIRDGWKGAIVSNVPYYHGGKDFWGSSEDIRDTYGPALMDDGNLEIMALAGCFHIGLCNIHVDNALRVGQGRHIELHLHEDCAVQVDGEPFFQVASTVTFSKMDQYPMLRATVPL